MVNLLLPWLSAFLFTQVVEVPIYVALMRGLAPEKGMAPPAKLWAAIAVAFAASAITHPIVWFVIPQIPASSYRVMVIRAESFAVVAEGLYFYAVRVFGLRRAMLVSLLANVTSAGLGLLSRAMLGWP